MSERSRHEVSERKGKKRRKQKKTRGKKGHERMRRE